jgi:hypothetical protein
MESSTCKYSGQMFDIQNNGVNYEGAEARLAEADEYEIPGFDSLMDSSVAIVENLDSPLYETFASVQNDAVVVEERPETKVQLPQRKENKLTLKNLLLLVLVLVILAVAVYLTFYRYSLVASAIENKQTGLSIALLSPEIGQGLGALLASL